jgi:hypothetical protein
LRGLIGPAIIYLIVAGLFGFWPFTDSLLKQASGECTYDSGYDDGWDGALRACEAEEYRSGYRQGAFDSDCHWLKCERRNRDEYNRRQCGAWDRFECSGF